MGVIFATGLFLILAFAWAMLAFVPGLLEIRRQKDTGALPVEQDSQVDIRHFARGFQDYLQQKYGDLIVQCRTVGKPLVGELAGDHSGFVIVPNAEAKLELDPDESEFCERMIISAGDLVLPDDFVHATEIQAAGDIKSGARSVYRAILAGGSLQLAAGSASLRWLHAGGDLSAGEGCLLHGRVSADGGLSLAAGCRFERLHGPVVDFGSIDEQLAALDTPASDTPLKEIEPQDVARLRDNSGGRWLVDKEFELKTGQIVKTDVVVRGTVMLRTGSVVQGSLKCRGTMTLEPGVRVTGSLICESEMEVGEDCRIGGPVICEETLTVQRGCIVGSADQPTTISARNILVEPGVRCHGTIWARDCGDVLAPVVLAHATSNGRGQTA